MGYEMLLKKQTNVIGLLSTDDVQNIISKPSNAAVAFTFPITCLLKSKRKQVGDSCSSFYTYTLDEGGYKDWHA